MKKIVFGCFSLLFAVSLTCLPVLAQEDAISEPDVTVNASQTEETLPAATTEPEPESESAKIDLLIADIQALGEPEGLTLEDTLAVEDVMNRYNALTDREKQEVPNETADRLENAVKKIASLNGEDGGLKQIIFTVAVVVVLVVAVFGAAALTFRRGGK